MPDFISTQSEKRGPDAKRDATNFGVPEDKKRPEDQDDEDFLLTARKRFNRCLMWESENRKNAIDDLLFKNGDQWPANIRTDRTLQKRPCLTINKMKTFVHQIVNNVKQNMPGISITPVGDGSDKTTAQMLEGMIRQIERQSQARIAYLTGFDSAVSNGWGYWRLLTDYVSDKSFNQCIKVCQIRNPMRVYLDPDHQMPDGSDAKWGFISDLIPRDEFDQMYPDADPVPFDQGATGDDNVQDWSTLTHVRIAEYYCYVTEKRKLIALATGESVFEDELPEDAKKLIRAEGGKELIRDEREVEAKRVLYTKITAHQVLEENEWPGAYIPIIKCIGDVVDIEGKPTMAGMIRDAKDPQRMKNYWATAKTELIALAPKAPFIVEEGQIEGHEKQWQMANMRSYPYLEYKGVAIGGKQAPPPQRQPFAGPPAGVIEAEQSAEQDMMGTTGVRFDSTRSERIPDESGKALKELKFLGELGSYHYTANFMLSLEYTGKQFIDLIPKVYDVKQVVTILREDDTTENVTIEPNLQAPFQTRPNAMGKVEKLYNPSLGEYAVAITTGPNFQTKRQEARDGMTDYMRAIGPDAARVVAGPIARNMDWPQADEVADRMDAMLPPQVLSKGLDQFGDIPPKVKAIIGSQQNQIQQMGQQMQQMGKELADKNAELGVKQRIGDQNYDAKLTQIAADLKMHVESLIAKKLGDKDLIDERGFEAARDQINREADRDQQREAARTKAASIPVA